MRLKLVVAASALALFLPPLAFAAFNDVTLTTDAVIWVGGYTLNISGSSATIQSIVVDTYSFSVTLASGSSFKVSSPSLQQLSSDVMSDVTSNTCTGSESSIALSYAGGGTITNVITPSATLCAGSGGGGHSGGGGGHTSSGSVANSDQPTTAPVIIPLSTPTTTPILTTARATLTFARYLYFGMSGADVSQLQQFLKDKGYYTYPTLTGYFGGVTKTAVAAFQQGNGIAPLGGVGPLTQAKLLALSSSTSVPASSSTPSSPIFTRDLHFDSVGADVRALQQYLNTHGFVVAPTGAGSAGSETTYFGLATQAALVKFQDAHASDILAPSGLTKGTGYFGPSTRSFVDKF
jgi:peptidoglycan hydrolase-like protein with peptidoglycan-binding domain